MIRYNKRLNNSIRKTVANYNAKITRLEKKNPYLALPDKISIRKLKQESETRNELTRQLNKLKRFSSKGAENTVILPSGEMVSQYELKELKRESARLKRNLTRRINQLANTTPRTAGKLEGFTYAEMGAPRLNNMIAKRDTIKIMEKNFFEGKDVSIKEFSHLLKTTRHKQNYQTEIFKNNYLDNMLFGQAYFIGYDQKKVEHIKNEMSKLSNSDFLKAFDEETLFQQIRDKYKEFKMVHGDNYFKYADELSEIYDNLYENIEKYLKDYPSYKNA